MTQSLWSRSMYSSGGMCFDGCTAEHVPSVQMHLSPSGASDGSGVVYSSENTRSSVMCSNQMEINTFRKSSAVHLSTRTPPSPAPGSHHDWGMNSGHQAKRARVENIIRGITCTDGTNKVEGFTQELPFHQKHTERSKRSGQTQTGRKRHQNRTEFRTEFNQTDGEETNGRKEESLPTWTDSPQVSPASTDSCSEFTGRNYEGWKKVKMNFQSKPDRIKLMADILKYELSRAVSRSVDSIFKSMSLLQTSSNDVEHVKTAVPNQVDILPTAESQVPEVQTEALSLVVQKPDWHQPSNLVSESGSAAPCTPGSLIPYSLESTQHRQQESERDYSPGGQRAARCWQDRGSEAGPDQLHTHWNSVKVKSKVTRTVRSPQTHTVLMERQPLESLYHPHVKLESDNLEKNNPYTLNECLTTNHLKKAKLMFFYTRYPSSLVLRMCFHDVQFTRCITSQLIKWFSNFREFYYIQMEKFARSALVEGVVDVRDLTVDRESELFRALNMHYNKANDFQVPERFLEVAERTLREFYVAISIGKDHDPSWKKTIYKVICKLDSDVPAEFKRRCF